MADDGLWTDSAGDDLWSTPANWSNSVVAGGTGFTAQFDALDIVSDAFIHLDSIRSIGRLSFGDTQIGSAAAWTLDDNGNAANILTLSGASPTITVDALGALKAVNLSAKLTGLDGLRKAGTGALRLLHSANTYTGGTTLDDGTLTPLQDGSLGAVPVLPEPANIVLNNGATLILGESNNMTLHANRGITLGPGLQHLTKVSRRGVNIMGVISGSGDLVFGDTTAPNGDGGGGGRLHLYGANTFVGDSIIEYQGQKDPGIWLHHPLALQNSTLVYETANTPHSASPQWNLLWFSGGDSGYTLGGLRGNKNLNLSPQGATCRTLKIGNNHQSTTYSGIISSSNDPGAGIAKVGTGTLTLSRANTYSGTTTISNGTLRLVESGAFANSPTVEISSAGILDVTQKGSYIMPASQTYRFKIDSKGAGQSGMLLAPTLDIRNAEVGLDFVGEIDDPAYVFATYSTLIGTQFASVTGIPENCSIDYAYKGNHIALITPVASPMVLIVR